MDYIIEFIRDLKWKCISDYTLHVHITLVFVAVPPQFRREIIQF